jgi:predicted PurR-regulated permease PerM
VITVNGLIMSFVKKVAFVTLIIIVLLVFRSTFNVLLMVLAASIIALYFHGLADLIGRKIRLSHKWCMFLSLAVTFLIMALLFWLVGAKVQSQIPLSEELPGMIQQAKTQLGQYSWGQKLLEQTSGPSSEKLGDSIKKLFSSTFGVLGDLYVILFLGIFFTADPEIYKKGIISLIPPAGKEEGSRVLKELGSKLTVKRNDILNVDCCNDDWNRISRFRSSHVHCFGNHCRSSELHPKLRSANCHDSCRFNWLNYGNEFSPDDCWPLYIYSSSGE